LKPPPQLVQIHLDVIYCLPNILRILFCEATVKVSRNATLLIN
jgi:hypothetical protein